MSIGIQSIPGARRLVRSLRDMGYEFESAVADLIDNSIAAGAKNVFVNAIWDGAESHVVIADDGCGMSADGIREALRFGAERDYADDDLGKFGLGLKTASLSQCRRMIVASRPNGGSNAAHAYSWDMDHVEATNRWEILPVSPADLPEAAKRHLHERAGTVVIWQQLDRILGYNNPSGEPARKRLIDMCSTLEEHVSMVFHRFLENKVRGKRLTIHIQDEKVTPWDPFVASEPRRQVLESLSMTVKGRSGSSDVVFEPFVLPAQAMFSSPEAHRRASGPNQWNRQQGFYIYRSDRLIQSGGWSGIRTLEEHVKLARIAVFFSPKLDEEFKINVPKMKVAFPVEIRPVVDKYVRIWTKIADETYRKANKALPAIENPIPRPSPKEPEQRPFDKAAASPVVNVGGGRTVNEPVEQPPSTASSRTVTVDELARVGKLLRNIAKPEELPAIDAAVARAQSTIGH